MFVDLDPASYAHDRQATIHLETNIPGQTQVDLALSVHWLDPVQVEPLGGVVSLGHVPVNESRQVEAKLIQKFGEPPLAFGGLTFNKERFAVEAVPEEADGHKRIVVRMRLQPQKVAGFFDETVEVATNSSMSPHKLRVIGTVDGALQVSPARLVIAQVQPGAHLLRTVNVQPRESGQGKLTKATPSSDVLTTEIAEENGKWRVKINYTAPATPAPIREFIDLVDDAGGTTRVDFTGTVSGWRPQTSSAKLGASTASPVATPTGPPAPAAEVKVP